MRFSKLPKWVQGGALGVAALSVYAAVVIFAATRAFFFAFYHDNWRLFDLSYMVHKSLTSPIAIASYGVTAAVSVIAILLALFFAAGVLASTLARLASPKWSRRKVVGGVAGGAVLFATAYLFFSSMVVCVAVGKPIGVDMRLCTEPATLIIPAVFIGVVGFVAGVIIGDFVDRLTPGRPRA